MDYLVLLWMFVDTSGVSEIRMFTNEANGFSSEVCEESLTGLQNLLDRTPKDAIIVDRTIKEQAFACELVSEAEVQQNQLYLQNSDYFLSKYLSKE